MRRWRLNAPAGDFDSYDPKVAIWAFDTDGSGMTNAVDEREIGPTINASKSVLEEMRAGTAAVDSAPTEDTDVVRKLEADSKADLTAPDGVLQSSQVPDLSIMST